MNFLIYIGTNPQDDTRMSLVVRERNTATNDSYIILLSNV
jgi:hypothetical protein